VPLGQYADGLLDPHPGGERVLKLGDGHRKPGRLILLADSLRRARARQSGAGRSDLGR
jgi:hypothetical protein